MFFFKILSIFLCFCSLVYLHFFSHLLSSLHLTGQSPKDPTAMSSPSGADHAVIGGVVAVIVFILLCLLIVFGRYLIRHKGSLLSLGHMVAHTHLSIFFINFQPTVDVSALIFPNLGMGLLSCASRNPQIIHRESYGRKDWCTHASIQEKMSLISAILEKLCHVPICTITRMIA